MLDGSSARPGEQPTPAVIYAAKSTDDLRGSIPAQIDDCRAAITHAGGRVVVAEEQDEGVSGYKQSRGVGLDRAKEAAQRHAHQHGAAELWVQHSDRLARGDGKTADHLAEIYFSMRKVGVRLRSVQDDSNLEDAIRAVLIGERNHEDSKRKSAATKAGKARQHARGRAQKDSYGHQLIRTIAADGSVATETRIDETRAKFVRQAFELADSGRTDLEIARALNDAGAPTKRAGRRGALWTRDAVRDTLANPAYVGAIRRRQDDGSWDVKEGCLPPIVDRDLWNRVQAIRAGSTAGQQAQRRGGRPTNGTFVLRGLAHCGLCGAPMHLRTGLRVPTYNCSAKQKAQACDARPVPARRAENGILTRLRHLVPDLDAWVAEKSRRADDDRAAFEATLNQEQQRLRAAQATTERIRDQWRRHLDAGDTDLADFALAELRRASADAADLEQSIERGRARLNDSKSAQEHDAGVAFFTELRDLVFLRIEQADSIEELARVLRVLVDQVLLVHNDDGHIELRVHLAAPDGSVPAHLDFLVTVGAMHLTDEHLELIRSVVDGSSEPRDSPPSDLHRA